MTSQVEIGRKFKKKRVARLSPQKKAKKSDHMMCRADLQLLREAVTPVPETSFKLTKL